MRGSEVPKYLENTPLVVPGCSASLVDNFALDWVIETLGLERVAVFDSDAVEAMVQLGVFGSAKVTAAVELYSRPESTVSVLQVRSNVVDKALLAKEILELGQKFARVIVVGAASGFLLSGQALEETSRFRTIGEPFSGKAQDTPAIELGDVHQGGLLKKLVSATKSKVPIASILVLTSGQGYMETCMLSEELAYRVITGLGLGMEFLPLVAPKSVHSLARPPLMTPELERIL